MQRSVFASSGFLVLFIRSGFCWKSSFSSLREDAAASGKRQGGGEASPFRAETDSRVCIMAGEVELALPDIRRGPIAV